MQVCRRSFFGVFLAILLLLSASLSQAAEFTATMITRAGGLEIPGKIYVKNNKMRNEVEAAGLTSIHIMRPDKKLMWIIMPQQKAYMEMPLSQEAQEKMMLLPENAKNTMKMVGADTINGYACNKYETVMTHQGKAMKVFTCIAPDLGLPIHIMSEDGSFSMEYRDIKPGQVEDALFEPPQGYNKMKMPGGLPQLK